MRLLAVVAAALLPSAAFAFPIQTYTPGWSYGYTNLRASGPTWDTSFDPLWNFDAGASRTVSYAHTESRFSFDGSAALTATYSINDQEDFYEARLTATAEAFASVLEGAVAGTRAFAQATTGSFIWSFSLDAPALYLGTLSLDGGYRNGDVLAAGNYRACFTCFNVNAVADARSAGETVYSRVTRTETVRFSTVPVPEPSVLLLLGASMVPILLRRRRAK